MTGSAEAKKAAKEVEKVLQGKRYRSFLKEMYGDAPDRWSNDLKGWARLRYITNSFTRMRCCDRQGRLELSYKGSLVHKDRRLVPWFRVPGRATKKHRIVFGHWSTLGYVASHNVWALDSGCLWGGRLTALRLGSEPEPIQVPCSQARQPHRDYA